MKIVFLNAIFNHKQFIEPLGLCYLAAVLRKSYPDISVNIYEPCINGDSIETVVGEIIKSEADLIGISSIRPNNEEVLRFVECYISKDPGARFIIGGHGVSLEPEKFLCNRVEAVFIGEGELSIVEFVKEFQTSRNYSHISGLIFYDKNGRFVRTNKPEIVNELDTIPFMARDVLVQLNDKYKCNETARILSSRGCYMSCQYCSIDAFASLHVGKHYRERKVESLLEEMSYLYNTYGTTKFLFEDDNFLPQNKNSAREKVFLFCKGLSKMAIPNVKLHMQCRPDSFDSESIKLLAANGLCDLFLGIETINEEDMKFFGRKSSVTKNKEVMKNIQNIGFSCDINANYRLRVGYIMFNPESTRETLLKSMHFLKENKVTPKRLTDYLWPYPGTKIYEKFLANNYLTEKKKLQFKDQEIGILSSASTKLIKRMLVTRDELRLPIKLKKELGIEYGGNELLEIDRLRCSCDNLCYKIFEDIFTSEVSNINETICNLSSSIDNMKNKIGEIFDFEVIKEKMGIQEYKKGLYR